MSMGREEHAQNSSLNYMYDWEELLIDLVSSTANKGDIFFLEIRVRSCT